MLLVAGVAALAGLSQLQLLIAATDHALRDRLTGVYGRALGEEFLEVQFQGAKRRGAPLSIAYLDLDDFKTINDRYGHAAGDHILQVVAGQLQSVFRKQDMVIRWGGEEFLIVMPDTAAEDAETIIARFMHESLCPRLDGSRQTASVGIADSGEADTADELLEAADTRMYRAKLHGKCQVIGPNRRRQPRMVAVSAR
jgi:diguanylate cyclase (GGDEF)-like protein